VTKWLESSPAKRGKQGLTLSWVIAKTLKMISDASLAFTLRAFKSCAKDKETVSGYYVSERKINLVLAI